MKRKRDYALHPVIFLIGQMFNFIDWVGAAWKKWVRRWV